MSSTTWQFNGAKIKSRALTVGDQLDAEITADILRNDAPFDARGNYRRQKFSEFLHSSEVVEGTLGFDLPSPDDATQEELQAAMEAWLALPGLLNAWRAALRSIEPIKK